MLDTLIASTATHLDPLSATTAGPYEVHVDEVLLALKKRSARGRSLGPNGTPVEVWATCQSHVAPLLAALYTTIGLTGCTPQACRLQALQLAPCPPLILHSIFIS